LTFSLQIFKGLAFPEAGGRRGGKPLRTATKRGDGVPSISKLAWWKGGPGKRGKLGARRLRGEKNRSKGVFGGEEVPTLTLQLTGGKRARRKMGNVPT